MIFHIGKTTFKLSFYFVALIVIMIILCEEKVVVYSLFSSLIHETGHLLFMCFSKDIPKKVEFSLFGMRIERANKLCVSYKKELIIALGGIMLNILTSVLCYVLYLIFHRSFFIEIAAINIIIAAVNSFPVSVLDSGRALRYAFLILKNKEKSEKYADIISDCFICVFTAVSALYIVFYGINISLIAINIYLIFITIIKKWS